MSQNFVEYGPTNSYPNFLASEIGLIPKTRQIPQSMGVADETGRLKVKCGTVYPTNDASAEGIVFPNANNCFEYDVTDGDAIGSVMTAGRVWENRLHTAPDAAAVTALEAKGLYFDTCPEQLTKGWPYNP